MPTVAQRAAPLQQATQHPTDRHITVVIPGYDTCLRDEGNQFDHSTLVIINCDDNDRHITVVIPG